MASTATLGNGTTVAFGTSTGFVPSYTEVEFPSESRPSINTSHLGTTTAHTFIPGKLLDNGSMILRGFFDAVIGSQPVFAAAAETITVVLFGSTIGYAFSGFVTDFKAGTAKNEELMTFECTVKITGAITKDVTV